MSQLVQPKLTVTGQIRANRRIAVAILLALITTALVVLALTAGSDRPANVSVNQPETALRADGGPEESAVAASIGSQPSAASPDESKIAAAIGSSSEQPSATGGPDESSVASAIAGH